MTTAKNSMHTSSLVMIANILEVNSNVILSTETSALSAIKDREHSWLVDPTASSHLSGNKSLFQELCPVEPVSIEIASGESFISSERGTINITIHSDPQYHLPDLPIMLQEVIYVPNLQVNLLSVGRMTNMNVNVKFSRGYTSPSKDSIVLAHGSKTQYICLQCHPLSGAYMHGHRHSYKCWSQSVAPENVLYKNTLDIMLRRQIIDRLDEMANYKEASKCLHCPFSKHSRLSFKYTEPLLLNVRDLIVCGPFNISMRGYIYFVIWIDARTCYTSIDSSKTRSV